MTIKNKIYTTGTAVFVLFLVLAAMNIWTHQQVLSNLQIRDEVNEKLDRIEKFASWKNELIRLISGIVASGHVPSFTNQQINFPSDAPIGQGTLLVTSGKKLVFLIGEKERASPLSDASECPGRRPYPQRKISGRKTIEDSL